MTAQGCRRISAPGSRERHWEAPTVTELREPGYFHWLGTPSLPGDWGPLPNRRPGGTRPDRGGGAIRTDIVDGGSGSCNLGNPREDRGEVGQPLLVAEAEDAVAVGTEVLRSVGILFDLLVVDISVDFDNELAGSAVEVEDERINGVLPAKAEPVELVAAQRVPQDLLGRRHRLAQVPRG